MRCPRRVAASPLASSGRRLPWRTRSACCAIDVCRYTTQPRSLSSRRFSASSTAPPPVASTMPSNAVSASIASRSRWRKPSSPSLSKMNGISTPVRRSISASLSWKGSCSTRARWRPTAVLPEPIGPTRNTLLLPIIRPTGYPKTVRPPEGGRTQLSPGPERSVIDAHALVHDLRSDEDHQLILVVLVTGVLEQVPEERDVPEIRDLGVVLALRGLEDAAEHHRLAVVHQHLGCDLAGVDRGDVHAAGRHHHAADAVVAHVEVHDDAVVGRDLRGDLERQHRLLELNGGGAARGGLLIRDLDALLDGRFLLVGGDHARGGDDVRLRLRLRRTQLEVDDEVAAEDAEREGARRVADRQVDVVTVGGGRNREGRTCGRRAAVVVDAGGRAGGVVEGAAVRVPAREAEDRSELALEVIADDDDARLDQHLPHRDVERRQ